MVQEASCNMCREISTVPAEGRINRIIQETENFSTIVTLGPLVLGHLLIVSREHYVSMGAIPEAHYEELRKLREELGTRLVTAFHLPQTVLFEHGPSKCGEKGGCCVEHAHLHIMPVRLPSSRIVRKVKEALGDYVTFESYEELKKYSEDGENAYTFFEFDGIKHFFEIRKPIPSQFVRQVIGKYVGREYTWDWRQNPRIEDIVETVERLKRGD
jgi:ATP adenylyltransferase